jgi:hypothetical protein
MDPASQADGSIVNPGESLKQLSAPLSARSEEGKDLGEFFLLQGAHGGKLSQYERSLITSALNPNFLQGYYLLPLMLPLRANFSLDKKT